MNLNLTCSEMSILEVAIHIAIEHSKNASSTEAFEKLSKKIENAFDESTEYLEIFKDGHCRAAKEITVHDLNIYAK